jgi:SAM-dependent methyltransferase
LREELFKQIELICPRCRQGSNEGVVQASLKLDQVFKRENDFVLEGFFVCSNADCGCAYPVLEGVPVVLKDIEGWWNAEKSRLCGIASDAPEIHDYFEALDLSEPTSHAERNLLSTYMDLHYRTLRAASDCLSSSVDPSAFWDTVVGIALPETEKHPRSIDLGCSVGRYTFELARLSDLALGIDINFSAVSSAASFHRNRKVHYERRKHGRQFEELETSYLVPENALFIVADVLEPPFKAESFDLVAGLNLLDNVKLPLVLIGQMDALLREGGCLVLRSPYEWRADMCEPAEWLENDKMDAPEMVRRILEGKMFPQMGLNYEVLQELFNVPWAMRNHDRYWSFFQVHLIKAKKVGT